MKKISLLFILFLISFLFTNKSYCQDFSLSISFLKKENDIKKSSRIESFSINDRMVSYSIVYSGYPNSKEMSNSKSCELSDNTFNLLIKTIYNDSINQNIYFYKKPFTNKEGISYTIISIVLVLEGYTYTIFLEADSNNIMDGNNYDNVMEFILGLRRIIKDC